MSKFCALQDTSQTSHWHVPANTIIQVGRLLKPREDEIAQVSLEPCQYTTNLMPVVRHTTKNLMPVQYTINLMPVR